MIRFRALGIPQPQGSAKAYQRGGRVIVTSDNASLRPWRTSVAWEARAALNGSDGLDGPVVVSATFYLPRPSSAPKRRRAPDRKPDLDKLARSLLDSLTEAGVVRDDAQVVDLIVGKRYATAEEPPGVSVAVAPSRWAQ